MSPITAINEQIRLSLRGVVGFSQIVMKLVEVLDMEFIKAEKAVDCFVSQVKEFSPYPEFLSPNKSKYKSQIDGIMRRSAFLPPVHSDAFYQLLKSTGIVNM